MAMKNTLTDRYVATVMAPGPSLGGVVEAYRGWQPCIDWCIEQIDRNNSTWHYVGEGVFEFEREQDRTCFLLKWA
jgi:hypothetical protein